jgi:hypothetical protein
MFSGSNSRRGRASLALTGVLSLTVVSAQQAAPSPDETIFAPITVRASNSASQGTSDEFLTGFIAVAVRFEGPKFISRIATAAKLRPDLAGKIVVCALNIVRLKSHLPGGRLSCATIDQIVKAAVTAAPQSAASIVKAAIESELYARSCIVAAAVAAAPGQEAEINAAANEVQLASILPTAGRFNPKDNAPFDNVNSPEQPPIGP